MSVAIRFLICASAAAAGAVGCAKGGVGAGGDDEPKHDASGGGPMDSRLPDARLPDAFIPPDAFVPPDAPPGALFCTMNAQCTVPGECCLTLGAPMGFCAPGTVILGECVPEL